MHLQLSEIKSGLLLTSIDSEHTVWLVMHTSYTNRRGFEKSLCMINTPSAIQLGPSMNLCHLHSVSSQVYLHNFQPSYSNISRSSYFSQASLLCRPVSLTLIVLESGLQSNLLSARGSLQSIETYMKYSPFNSLVRGSLGLAPSTKWERLWIRFHF